MCIISKLYRMNKQELNDLFDAIHGFDQQQAKELFESVIDKADVLVNDDNATLLHAAANENNHEILRYFIDQYDKRGFTSPQEYTFERKKVWLNRKDNDGFTCIHYAVFRGNTDLAFYLQQQGSDIYAINKQGLTVMHIAAQGDSPVLMSYYMSKGMKISAEDGKGSTALHWACYSGQQNAAYSLLAWGAQLDKQDFTYGMTPLHLAVMSGNGRIVKKLLVRGCDRNIKNYSGKLPLDLALQNQYKNITQMIIDKRGIEELFNIKTPYRMVGKVTFPFYFLLVLYLTNYILNVSFVLFQHFPQGGDLAFAYLIIGLVVGVLFLVVAKRQPGFICIEEGQNDFDMLRKYHPSKICFDCMLVKPDRSRHCQICKRCVSVYDHHCPWVTNCIGSQNYFWFYCFLVMIWSFMSFTLVFEIINIVELDWTDHSALEIIRIVCVVYSLLCSCLFIIPLTYLLIVQTTNAFSNQTTFERYGFQNKVSPSKQGSSLAESLSEGLLEKKNSNATIQDMEESRMKSSRLYAQTQVHPCYNCYLMCVGNANNIVYQMGKIR